MKVFVVVGGWEHEGFNEPSGIFETLDEAEGLANKLAAESGFHIVQVFKYEVGSAGTEQLMSSKELR